MPFPEQHMVGLPPYENKDVLSEAAESQYLTLHTGSFQAETQHGARKQESAQAQKAS